MSYTVKEITVKYDLTAKSVYDAAKNGKIIRVPDSKPIRYTKASVDKYWSRRDQVFQSPTTAESIEARLDDHERRLIELERLNVK